MPGLNPLKMPRQGRSRATCDAILDAAARILEREGRKGLTTNHIAEKAGVSIGSLYQYFPGKEAILAELIRRMRREMLADLSDAARKTVGAPLPEVCDALIRASLRHHAGQPDLARALEREEAELPLDAETAVLKARLKAVVVDVLAERGVEQPERTAFDLVAISHGMADAYVTAGGEDMADLAMRVRRAVLGYLGLPFQQSCPPVAPGS